MAYLIPVSNGTTWTQITEFMWPTWGPPGSCRPQMGTILAPWTLVSGHGNVLVWTAHLKGEWLVTRMNTSLYITIYHNISLKYWGNWRYPLQSNAKQIFVQVLWDILYLLLTYLFSAAHHDNSNNVLNWQLINTLMIYSFINLVFNQAYHDIMYSPISTADNSPEYRPMNTM